MNRFAYLTTGLFIKAFSDLSKTRIRIFDEENIPEGSIIYVINHFTRIETLFLPYYINQLTDIPVWSLADYQLFSGGLGSFLDKVGAVSTKDPDRDILIVKTLLTGEVSWIIFPEGLMVKNKKIYEKGRFMLSYAGGKHPPHTGAATLGLRTEFYRERLRRIKDSNPEETKRLMELYQIESLDQVFDKSTYIVPVNLTYYPIRARENIILDLANKYVEDIPDRMVEEIMTEGTMLLAGVDINIRFGKPIRIKDFMTSPVIERDISSEKIIRFDDPISSKRSLKINALKIMQQYMTQIYSMTTINHDHLFASFLRMMPRKKIHEDDLKRRVFLAINMNTGKEGVFFHRTLLEDQIHLLTDDHFEKFQNFISMAVEKGVVERDGKILIKDTSKFSSIFDFHSIRVENPVNVIANEVEPLTSLQKNIKSLAGKFEHTIRRMVADLLIKKGIQEYNEDYNTYYIEGETKDKEVGKPFLIKGRSRKKGIVLVHGYMASPLEVKELAVFLGKKGYWVYVPRLKGHGTSPEDLSTRKYVEWVKSVEEGYAIMKNLCEDVFIGGFSTGAGLALDLGTRITDLKGIIAVSPPMKLHDFSTRFVPAVDMWNKLMNMVNIDAGKKEFVENDPENPHINYHRNPISGLRELERLMDSLESRLPDLKIPTIVIQSERDPVVDPEGSRKLFSLLGSENKRYVLVNMDKHGILLGEGVHEVYEMIYDFIDCQG
jgi:esterase/lipase/1-acyl-sn-glycerol-3-phosphate acyltransferase